MTKETLMVACRKFFGYPPSGSKFTPDLKGFAEEMHTLTDKDKADFIEMFKTIDIEIIEPQSGKSNVVQP